MHLENFNKLMEIYIVILDFSLNLYVSMYEGNRGWGSTKTHAGSNSKGARSISDLFRQKCFKTPFSCDYSQYRTASHALWCKCLLNYIEIIHTISKLLDRMGAVFKSMTFPTNQHVCLSWGRGRMLAVGVVAASVGGN